MAFMDDNETDRKFMDESVSQQDPVLTTQNLDPLKAQAAMLALTEKSLFQAQDSYKNLMNGVAPPVGEVYRKTQEQSAAALNEMVSAVPLILSDPNISQEDKNKLISQVQRGELRSPDVANRLQAAMVIKEHGADDYSDKVITKTFRQLSIEAQNQWSERQEVINAATANRDGTVKKVADFVGMLAPMGDAAIITGVNKAAKENPTTKDLGGNLLYSMALPGSSFAEFHKKFHTLPYEEQTAVIKELTGAIQNSSSLFTSDNQVRAANFLSDLTNPEYSTFDKYLANGMNILDAVGLGQLIKGAPSIARGIGGAAKGLAERGARQEAFRQEMMAARQEPSLFADVVATNAGTASPVTQASDLASVKSTPQRNVNTERLRELEAQHSSLLEENLTPLGKGEVTRLNALKAQLEERLAEQPKKVRQRQAVDALKERNQGLDAQIRRVDEALEQNRIAQTNIEQISSLEKEMASLRKSKDMEDIPISPLNQAIQRAYMQGTVFTHNPRTAGNIAMNSNPNEARNLLYVTSTVESDEMAQALYGVGKNEALIKSVAPQVTDSTGRVKYVTPDMEQTLRRQLIGSVDNIVMDPVAGLQLTEAEVAAGRANIVSDYTNAVGVKLHPAMTSIASEADGSRVRIQAIYGAGDTGWLTPEDAISQAQYALRSRGVTADDITLMVRDGDEFVPVKAKDVAGKEGEYFARIDVDEYITAEEVGDLEKFDVKKNILDRLFGHGTNQFGSAQSHVLPITSMLHPTLVGSAMVADDKVSVLAEALLKKLDQFSKPYMSFPKERRQMMMQYIEEANAKEIPFNRADLSARGFTTAETDALSNWREFWDMDWKLENLDLARTLNSQGFQWMENTNISAAVKPRPKNYAITEVYDSAADVVRPIDRTEIDQIYAMGGNIGEFKRPLDVNGAIAEYVINRNNPSEFTRKIRLTDNILERREGYYQVHHKATKFIEETFKASNGKMYTHTIATTGTTEEAKKAVELLTKRDPSRSYSYRGDERGIERGSREYWDLNTTGGRIAQRHRSNLIQNNVGLQAIGATNHVENPVEAGLKATASISGRTAMRPVLETAKERFMQQYGHLVSGIEGIKSFPTDLGQIAKKGEFSSKELADARTTWNYIQYLENGYINHIDSIYKNGMRLISDITGEKGYGTIERAAKEAGETSLSGLYKTTVFSAYLATNPFRQFLVQGNQGLRSIAYNPKGYASGSVFNYFHAPFSEAFGIPLTKTQKEFKAFMEETGMYQAVSKNNLIRGTLLEASEKSTQAGVMLNKIPQTTRRIGFDQGERFNLISHGAAVYDEFVRAGKDVTNARVKAEMHDRIRAITLDMNYAGDMPYNQNALSFLMTYMQVGHKAVSAVTSRRIPASIRNRMMAYDLAMWGLPVETIGKVLDLEGITPEDPEFRRMMEDGLQSWYLNKMWSELSDEEVAVDYSSLSPMSLDNWTKMFQAMWFDGGISKMLDSTAGSKVLGVGMDSRLGVALNMTGSFFKDFYEETDDPTRVIDVLDSWARISSGWNNYQKARMQWALGVAKDKNGNVVDSSVGKMEAVAQFFGFGTEDTRNYYKVLDSLKKSNQAVKDLAKEDVDKFIQLAQVKTNGMATDMESLRMHSKMMMSTSRFISPQQRADYLNTVSQRLFTTPEANMWQQITQSMGFVDNKQIVDNIRRAPGLTEDQKAHAERVFLQTRKTIETMKEGN